MVAMEKSMQPICLIVSALCVIQAAYGILQYAYVASAGNGFRVTGSFDNPAGFAACLCAGFPFLLYFILCEKSWKLYLAIAAGIIVIAAVIFSASRAGIISLTAVGLAVFLYKVKVGVNWKWIAALTLLLALLSGLYFLKKDSADGRLLIWRCSWEMVKDKPLLGHGHGGFKAGYMNYQAKYFEEHPDSEYAMLADNVNRPFNEYVLLLIDYGLAGLLVFLIFGWFLWKSYRRCSRSNHAIHVAVCCLLSVGVFSPFSYPLTYPFVWIMALLSIAVIVYHAKYPVKISSRVLYPVKFFTILAILFFVRATWPRMSNEIRWCKIAHQSLLGKTEQMLPEYERLYPTLSNNELFLYNYAAELNVAGNYSESLQIGKKCEQLWADYDLQMLMADNYEKLLRYSEAEQRYKRAAAMCPVKFMPLYKLAKLHEEQGNIAEAQELAKIIIDKKVKIPSHAVAVIKHEMQQLVEREENRTSATQCEASETPNIKVSRQGEAPEVQPHGSALPP